MGRWRCRLAWLGVPLLSWLSGCVAPPKSPLTVWAVDGQEWLAADTAPVLENDAFSGSRGRISLTTAVNAVAGFQLGLHAEAPPLGPYQVEISDLAGPRAKLSADANVALFRVQPVRIEHFRSWYPEYTGRPAVPTLFPDIAVPWDAPQGGGPVTLAGADNAVLWIDIRVPPTTDPGVYQGKLSVRPVAAPSGTWPSRGQPAPAFECELRLQVLPVELPSERTLPVICRIDPSDLFSTLGWPRETPESLRLLTDDPQHTAAIDLLKATMQLFQEHRTTPVLWASFPKYRPTEPGRVAIEWEPYDRLVEGWISSEAFRDLVGLSYWPIPVSLNYPPASQEGGLGSPSYARLLSAYVSECRRHFEERGWLNKAFVRPCPPAALTDETVEQVRQVSGILRQGEAGIPLVAHLPPRTMRGFGWRNAPQIELSGVGIWAPEAMFWEPEAMYAEASMGRRVWMVPDFPPYSGTLEPEGLPSDPTALPWEALRYECGALWVEHAAEFGQISGTTQSAAQPECLIYPGGPYGLPDRPLASLRLKRLRAGLQDHALLTLLERRGKHLLVRSLAEQLVRWGGTDACLDHLLSCKPASWPRDAHVYSLARSLALQELAPGAEVGYAARLAEWQALMNDASRVSVTCEGVRVDSVGNAVRVAAFGSVLNARNQPLTGRWTLPQPPVGWSLAHVPELTVGANARSVQPVTFDLAALAYDPDGVHPFELRYATTNTGTFAVPTRLAVAACPVVLHAPTIDGDLSDWAIGSNNVASDFRLVRGVHATAVDAPVDRPSQPTQAFFGHDRDWLYVAVRCSLTPGEQPLWLADNRVPLDGAVPWGQDVVEVLIDPRPGFEGSANDIHVLQIKPNGVLVTRIGCLTSPPIGKSEVWQSGAAVAVQVQPDAWVVELGVPLASLGPAAAESGIWGVNVARLDARRGEYSSWSGARGTCYSPQALGNLIFIRP